MDNREFSNLGDQIRDSVQSAIDSMDFKQLNRTISDTVNFALDEARGQMTKGTKYKRTAEYERYTKVHEQRWERSEGSGPAGKAGQRKEPAGNHGSAEGPGYRAFQTSRDDKRKTGYEHGTSLRGNLTKLNQPGRIAGILYTVFGSIGLCLMLIVFLCVWIVALIVKPVIWTVAGASAFLLVLGGGFGYMLWKGISMKDRLKRAGIYTRQAGRRMYCSIEELAGNIGRSREFVLKDIQKMIETGMIPEAHLDEQKTCLILSDSTYRQYLECQKALKEREQEKAREEKEEAAREESRKDPEELEQMMAAGRNYLRILREANDAIPGEVISGKISRLEDVIRRIFDTVLKHPEQLEEMERFMEYYLPTTVKLVTTYRDFDSVGTQGANIASAKKEIEGTLDTINQAFERLLDDLYQDAVLDITTDASVLQTMLKKDGWAESDFAGGKKNE
ncbi:5-bromo-4-chloroindolyl phosphate hydrolysis family protein [Lachnospiraceae bacterium 54-53]